MSYFLDLLGSLNEEERQKLAKMSLLGKEKLVRDMYLSIPEVNNASEQSIADTLQLSRSHFDKVLSVLLDKSLTHLAGDSFDAKMDFAVPRQLHDLVLHELKLVEKKLKSEEDKNALKLFYKTAFRSVGLFAFNNFPEDLMTYYCKKYTALLNENEKEEYYRAWAFHEEMIIHYHRSRKDGVERNLQALYNLEKWERELQGTNFHMAMMRVKMGISAYYEISDFEKSMEYLLEADAAARQAYDRIAERDKAFLLVMAANKLIDLSRYAEGNAKYEEAIARFSHLIKGKIFHPYNFVFGLLIAGNYKRATEIMEEYLDPILKNENARNYQFDILRLHAICYLLDHQTEKAGATLQQILQYGKEDFTPLGDLLFRFVHNVYCVQSGDYSLADDVLKKNQKFIRSKKGIADFEVYKHLFSSLGKVIRMKTGSLPTPRPFPEDFFGKAEGKAKLYQRLLELPFKK